ncbi:hypothetical protein SLEP1_g18241 [Rubroshorea leprosula]|uniref:Uncharacterized protein n=1 Tax=Rubroshorea leprosula TaxID=152421 RepID=A0AAV5J2P6_9ROSI|nr:hypothetical protein SLEP1_g18241 [Rubroshorea leprosula]
MTQRVKKKDDKAYKGEYEPVGYEKHCKGEAISCFCSSFLPLHRTRKPSPTPPLGKKKSKFQICSTLLFLPCPPVLLGTKFWAFFRLPPASPPARSGSAVGKLWFSTILPP